MHEGDGPWFVEDDETIALIERPAWGYGVALFAKALVGLSLVGLVAYLAVSAWLPAYTWLVGTIAGGSLAIAAVWAWRRCVTSLYVVTDKRVYAKRGRLLLGLHFATHDRITDVRYDRGAIDRLLGIGHLGFATAGADIRLPGLADARQVQRAGTEARDAFVEELLSRAGLEAEALTTDDARPSPARTPPAEPAEEDRQAAEDREPVTVDPARQGLVPYEGAPPEYVARAETVRWLAKPTKAVLLNSLGFLLVLASFIASAAFADLVGAAGLPFGGAGLAAVLVLGILGFQWLRLEHTELVLTDDRVYLKRGIVATNVNQITYDKITDIAYDEGILGRVLGFATLEVNTSGSTSTPISVAGITEALAVKRLVEEAAEA